MNGSAGTMLTTLTGSLSNTSQIMSITTPVTTSANVLANRQKKYRTLSKIKGLFLVSAKNESDDYLFDLPPQQMKNELSKKMIVIQSDIEKQQKERYKFYIEKNLISKDFIISETLFSFLKREGLLKLREIYSKNQKFGDSQSAELALKSNDEKLNNFYNQLKKYQDFYNQVDSNQNKLQQQTHIIQQQQAHYFECSSNGSTSSDSNLHSNSNTNINNNNNTTIKNTNNINNQNENNNQNNNESFEDEVDDDADENDDGCYEVVNRNLVVDPHSQNNNLNVNYDTNGGVFSAEKQQQLLQQKEEVEEDVIIGTALVIYSFEGNVQNAISIEENESLSVLERDSGDGWTLVKKLNDDRGYVPTDYIRIVYY
jgi:hypothetical protein